MDPTFVGLCDDRSGELNSELMANDLTELVPGMMVVCIENFAPQASNHLKLTEGDIIEVTGLTDSGMFEGSLRGQMGFFPTSCVQEIRMKVYEPVVSPQRTYNTVSGKSALPRIKKIWGEPHTVILHRGQEGFGFVLRGAKSDSPLMDLPPSDRFPALQYLDDVDMNGVADRAGLRKGDFILAINGLDVAHFSHETVVDLIRKSGDVVSMTVVGLSYPLPETQTKPGSPSSATCDQTIHGSPKLSSNFATLPRKYSGTTGPNAPSPPRRDPSTILSVGRTRAKSMVAALADLELGPGNGIGTASKTASIRARPPSGRMTTSEMHSLFVEHVTDDKNGHVTASTLTSDSKVYSSVAVMKRSKNGSKTTELVKLHKDFHSTPDLKASGRSKSIEEGVKENSDDEGKTKSLSQDDLTQISSSRHSWACQSPDENNDYKDGHDGRGSATGDSKNASIKSLKNSMLVDAEYRITKPIRPIVSKTLPRRASTGSSAQQQESINSLVPPGQVIKVDISKSSEYATLDAAVLATRKRENNSIMSSFKPRDSAKLYESPEDLRPIGYREKDQVQPTAASGKQLQDTTATAESASAGANIPVMERAHTNGNMPDLVNGSKRLDNARALPPGTTTTSQKEAARPSPVENGSQRQKESQEVEDPKLSLIEAKERLRPVLKVSQPSNVEPTKIRIEVKQSPRLQRKAEKTVTFQPEPQAQGQLPHSMSVDEIQKFKSSLKCSKSFPNDLTQDEEEELPKDLHDVEENAYVTCVTINQETKKSEDPSKPGTGDRSSKLNFPDHDEQKQHSNDKFPPAPTYEELAEAQKPPIIQERSYKQIVNVKSDRTPIPSNILAYGTISRSQQAARNANVLPTKSIVSSTKYPPSKEPESDTGETGSTRVAVPQKKSVGSGTYHTLQPQKTRSLLGNQQQYLSRQLQQIQQLQHPTPQARQAEKSIEESLKLIQMHMATLKEEFPVNQQNVVPPPPEFGLRNQTPILAPPPEFSDVRNQYESATRFNQGYNQSAESAQAAQELNRQSPMYRSISHGHSSSSSMYSGYPTMTRQQYNQQLHQQQLLQQKYLAQHYQMALGNQQPAAYATSNTPTYQTLGRLQGHSAGGPQLHNSQSHLHYGTLGSQKSMQAQLAQHDQNSSVFQQHHPRCYYYQQVSTTDSGGGMAVAPSSAGNVTSATKYIPEKLHPVHRYTPDLADNSPRIVGTTAKRPIIQDHYEVPHLHQQQLLLQQQQQQANRARREFRNKPLPEWSVPDTCDWLDSVFMPEYKVIFQQKSIDGSKLLRMDNASLLELGVKKLGHRMNMEKSLKRYHQSIKR